jgi:hydrogenase expression/formation protein HypC
MCLGIPARVVDDATGHADLVVVDMAGVRRTVNVGLLDDPRALAVGDWLLVHMGFALSTMTEDEAGDALAALGAERAALDALREESR